MADVAADTADDGADAEETPPLLDAVELPEPDPALVATEVPPPEDDEEEDDEDDDVPWGLPASHLLAPPQW